MVFQAFRARFGGRSLVGRLEQSLIINYSIVRVPCGPVRSSFASAFEDVKKARDNGFCAAVRVINPHVTI